METSPPARTGPAANPRRSWRLLGARLLALAVACAAGLLLLEGLVRMLLPRFNPRNQLIVRLNEEGVALGIPRLTSRQGTPKGDFDVTVSFNRHGFRDPKDFTQAATNALFVVGDSFSIGWGVEEPERYSSRIEAATGSPVYNISAPAEDIRGYARILRSVRRQGGTVRHLVVGLCMENDLWDYEHTPDTHAVYAQQARHTLRQRLAGWVRGHSALWACGSHALQKHEAVRRCFEKLGIARNIEEMTHQNEATPAVVASSRDQLLGIVTNYHAVVLIIPSRGLWYGANTAVEREAHRRVLDSLRQAGVALVDLKPVFEKSGEPLGFYFKNDPHWNSRGHATAAEALCQYFSQADDWRFLLARTSHAARPADRRSADFQSVVSRVSNPLSLAATPAPCRLEVGDTADWKSALRAFGASGQQHPVPGEPSRP